MSLQTRRDKKLVRTSVVTYGRYYYVGIERTHKFSFTNLFLSTRFDVPSPLPQQSYSSLMQLQDSRESHSNKPAVPRIIDVVSLRRGDHSKVLSTKDRLTRNKEWS